VKGLFKSKYMGSMNRKPLRQRIKDYNKRWRERYEWTYTNSSSIYTQYY